MARQWYSKKHYQRVCGTVDTPDQITWRHCHNRAVEQVKKEVDERITSMPDDFWQDSSKIKEFLDWQQSRIDELLAADPQNPYR